MQNKKMPLNKLPKGKKYEPKNTAFGVTVSCLDFSSTANTNISLI